MMGKIYCSSDWHGDLQLAEKILNYLQQDDKLYFLGDAIDRKPNGLKIFQMLISDPRVIFLKGNHEQMMADAIPAVIRSMEDINYIPYINQCYELWSINSNYDTEKDLRQLTKKEILKIKKTIDNMKTCEVIKNTSGKRIFLCHAGWSPYCKKTRTVEELWDREHLADPWINLPYAGIEDVAKDTYVIHGHTPVQVLKYESYYYNGKTELTEQEKEERAQFRRNHRSIKPTVLHYCEGHKIDIDMGTAFSNRTVLFDLDTFEEIYFDRKENSK